MTAWGLISAFICCRDDTWQDAVHHLNQQVEFIYLFIYFSLGFVEGCSGSSCRWDVLYCWCSCDPRLLFRRGKVFSEIKTLK